MQTDINNNQYPHSTGVTNVKDYDDTPPIMDPVEAPQVSLETIIEEQHLRASREHNESVAHKKRQRLANPTANDDLARWDELKTLYQNCNSADADLFEFTKKAKVSKAEAKRLRAEFCDKLSTLKCANVGVGREGKWGRMCDHIGIARSTADRWLKEWDEQQERAAHEEVEREDKKLLSEELRLKEQREKLATKFARELARRLKTLQEANEVLEFVHSLLMEKLTQATSAPLTPVTSEAGDALPVM